MYYIIIMRIALNCVLLVLFGRILKINVDMTIAMPCGGRLIDND